MKYFSFFLSIFLSQTLSAQQLGSVSSASNVGQSPFSVGEIYVEGTLSGFVGVYSFLVGNDLLTSAVDLDLFDDFTIMPNPTDGMIAIRSEKSHIKNLQLFDVSGRLVKAAPLQNAYDLTDLLPGIYFLQINHKNTFKIIKK